MALSPWPTATAAVTLKAATDMLREALGEANATDAQLQRLGAAVSAHVERYAPNAPQSVKDEAILRAAGWLWDTRGAQRFSGVSVLNMQPAPVATGPWFRHSGAMALLSPFKCRRAGAIG